MGVLLGSLRWCSIEINVGLEGEGCVLDMIEWMGSKLD